jgi:peptidoglycan/xylan/chitin deacetylase (PgdA/CDA1 family)
MGSPSSLVPRSSSRATIPPVKRGSTLHSLISTLLLLPVLLALVAATAPAAASDSLAVPLADRTVNFSRGSIDRSEIVLSFDAGSSARGASDILDVLRQYGIRTTFFLTGRFIERYPDVVRQIVDDGHEVANHTWSHPRLTTYASDRRQATLPSMSRERLHEELNRTAAIFRELTGAEMSPYWRAPYGEENAEIRRWAAELGYLHVGWTRGRRSSLDALDWVSDPRASNYLSPQRIAQRILSFEQTNETTLNGGIVLMHVSTERKGDERPVLALPILIEQLLERGFRFVTVGEMEARSRDAG